MGMTISELGRSAGVGVETIRFYQRRGLLRDPRPGSVPGAVGRKHYGEDEVKRLRFIRAAQRAGFTLDEIGELLRLDRTEDRARVRALALGRIAALDERIVELQTARAALNRLAGECAGGLAGPCPIIEAFEDGRSTVQAASN